MKKVLTIVLVAMLTIVGQQAIAQGNSHAKGKRPEFVNEKHRAHAEWKREKEQAKKHKKYNKKHDRNNDDRRGKDEDRRYEDRDRRDYPWGRSDEQRRVEERRRTEEQRRVEERRREDDNPKTIRDVILRRTGGNQ